MSATSRNTQCFAAVLLVLVVTATYGCAPAAQQPSDAATARLKALSESRNVTTVAEIRQLIKDGAEVNVRNKFGATPLFMASHAGRADVVKLLLASKADVNAARTNGTTSLYVSSQNGHIEVVKLLLAAGADVNRKDNLGFTPLTIAKKQGHTQIIKLLREHGAKESDR